MAYVIQGDIIANIDETFNMVQGTSHIYSIELYRDYIGNVLHAENASSINVAVVDRLGRRVLMYSNPFTPGVSDILNVGSISTNNIGIISFEILGFQSRYLEPGDLHVVISIVYNNYYPTSKTYVLPAIKIGQSIEGDFGGGGGGGGTDPIYALPSKPFGSPEFMIEHVNLDMPSANGRMSINSQNPLEITKMIFKNLDKNLVRLTSLENFLINRMTNDKIEGILTLYSIDNPTFYSIFKIISWSRVDIVQGNGDSDNIDGIELTVLIESITTGPGVSKTIWQVGNNIAFSIDTHGITGENIKPEGILTFTDKNKKISINTNGNNYPTGIHITYSPYYDSYVMVEINGISVDVGNNTKNAACYFSGNNGVTAIAYEEIRSGDQLIWNGSIAGFELEINDEINLIYEVNVDDLR